MPWNSTCPLGTVSVKANKPIGQQNTTYIETTMGNSVVGTNTNTTRDHFWNVGANEDGRHRFINSPAFTVGGNPADAVLGTGMDSVLYAKTVKGTVQWFQRNAGGIYQWMPAFLTGTVSVTSDNTYVNITAVPTDVYGEIFMYIPDNGIDERVAVQTGYFRSNGTKVNAWSIPFRIQGSSTNFIALKFGNGSDASGLNLRVRADAVGTIDDWTYFVTYRAT